jgi:hypothetical protein
MERIKSGIQDVAGIPERVWGMPMPDEAIEARRELTENKPTVIRAPTMLENVRDTLQPVTSVFEMLGNPLENADMGPAKAIALVARAKGGLPGRLTGEAELLERLIPRNAMGEALDYRTNPKIYDALTNLIERHPRVSSHINGIEVTDQMPKGWRAAYQSNDRITKQIQTHGAEAWKNADRGHVGTVKISPEIEQSGAAESLAHEFTHAAQYIADPRRFNGTYDEITKAVNRRVSPGARQQWRDPGYTFNPAEVSARAVGKRHQARADWKDKPAFKDVLRQEGPPGVEPDELGKAWKGVRAAWEQAQRAAGIRIDPIKLPPPRTPAPPPPGRAKPGQPTLFDGK